MKKIVVHVFVMVLLSGLFSVAMNARAADPKGDCTITHETTSGNESSVERNVTETYCTTKASPTEGISARWEEKPSGTCTITLQTNGDDERSVEENVTETYCIEKASPTEGISARWEVNADTPDAPPAPNTTYTLLAPLPCPAGTLSCPDGMLTTYEVGDNNQLGRYLNTALTIFIGICALLAMIMIIIGGLEYMTSELVSSKEGGKDKITQAIFGLVLALGAWTILNTINPDFLNADLKSLTATELNIALTDNVPQTPVDGKYGNYAANAPWDDTVAINTPIPSWAIVKQPPCTYVGQRNCTSVRGLTGQYLNTIHANCPNCQIVITEGTAFWKHGGATGSTSHGVGSPTVDLRITPSLTQYIVGGTRAPKKWEWFERDGVDYLFEGDHWHAEKN